MATNNQNKDQQQQSQKEKSTSTSNNAGNFKNDPQRASEAGEKGGRSSQEGRSNTNERDQSQRGNR